MLRTAHLHGGPSSLLKSDIALPAVFLPALHRLIRLMPRILHVYMDVRFMMFIIIIEDHFDYNTIKPRPLRHGNILPYRNNDIIPNNHEQFNRFCAHFGRAATLSRFTPLKRPAYFEKPTVSGRLLVFVYTLSCLLQFVFMRVVLFCGGTF